MGDFYKDQFFGSHNLLRTHWPICPCCLGIFLEPESVILGMKQLHDWFGNCSAPRVGWQIDPFGHSSENARLFDWMGFDGLFFARNDYRDKDQRMENKTLDMIWNTGNIRLLFSFPIFLQILVMYTAYLKSFGKGSV